MSKIPFNHIDWTSIEKVEHKADKGFCTYQTIQYTGLRIRLVIYSKDFLADYWVKKDILFIA